MPTPIPYPLVNGRRPQFADIGMTWLETATIIPMPIVGFKSISYRGAMKGAYARGASVTPLGLTDGDFEGEGSMEIGKPEWAGLCTLLAIQGVGYMQARFDIQLTYRLLANAPLAMDTIFGVKIEDEDENHQSGPEHLTVRLGFKFIYYNKNGAYPVNDLQALTDNALVLP